MKRKKIFWPLNFCRIFGLLLGLLGGGSFAVKATPLGPACPANAWCGEQALKANEAWRELPPNPPLPTINQLIQKYGPPLPAWALLQKPAATETRTLPADLPANFIGWDSPCSHHQKNEHLILKGYSFQKELRNLPPSLQAGKAYGASAQGQNLSWLIPAGETPILREGNYLIFTIDFEGKYFHLKIDPQGKILQGPWRLDGRRPREVKCPEALRQQGQKELTGQNQSIFQESFCKEIWDLSTHSYQTMLFFWACD